MSITFSGVQPGEMYCHKPMTKEGMQGRAAGSSLTAMYNQRPVDAPDVRCQSHLVEGRVEMVSL